MSLLVFVLIALIFVNVLWMMINLYISLIATQNHNTDVEEGTMIRGTSSPEPVTLCSPGDIAPHEESIVQEDPPVPQVPTTPCDRKRKVIRFFCQDLFAAIDQESNLEVSIIEWVGQINDIFAEMVRIQPSIENDITFLKMISHYHFCKCIDTSKPCSIVKKKLDLSKECLRCLYVYLVKRKQSMTSIEALTNMLIKSLITGNIKDIILTKLTFIGYFDFESIITVKMPGDTVSRKLTPKQFLDHMNSNGLDM
eukprot:787825_1